MLEFINPVLVGGVIAAAMFGGILFAMAFGRRIGRRHLAIHGLPAASAIGSLETAVFALLGLMIAFTFSGALTRFDVRRAQAVQEANAIGTAYLRVDLLPVAVQPRLRETFRNYVDARIATYRKLPDIAAALGELARSQKLQGEIWVQAIAATAMPESRAASPLLVLPAINDMFDIATVRIVATRIHPPTIIYAMLIALALASALLAGYQAAGERAMGWVHQVGFAGIVAVTVYVIFEIEYPRLGFVRLDAIDQVLVDARAAMN